MLLYLVYKGISIDAVGFEPAYLRAIPHLAACGVFRYENGKARVDIPVISKAAYQEMDRLRIDAMNRLAEVLTEPLRRALPEMKLPVPAHLRSRVAAFRQYSCYAIPMGGHPGGRGKRRFPGRSLAEPAADGAGDRTV